MLIMQFQLLYFLYKSAVFVRIFFLFAYNKYCQLNKISRYLYTGINCFQTLYNNSTTILVWFLYELLVLKSAGEIQFFRIIIKNLYFVINVEIGPNLKFAFVLILNISRCSKLHFKRKKFWIYITSCIFCLNIHCSNKFKKAFWI